MVRIYCNYLSMTNNKSIFFNQVVFETVRTFDPKSFNKHFWFDEIYNMHKLHVLMAQFDFIILLKIDICRYSINSKYKFVHCFAAFKDMIKNADF